jgi:predicted transcriptional regulator YdeE
MMSYQLAELEPVTIAGITVRTDNSPAGLEKIGQLWAAFFRDGVMNALGDLAEGPICEAYYDYESDAQGAYTVILGSRVPADAQIPAPLQRVTLPAARYAKFAIDDPKAIYAAWQHIWQRQDIDRSYSGDFEIIGENSADIYIALRP